MLNKLILFIIIITDHFHKKKIVKFFKKKKLINFNCIFDIGAHKGETIKFFLKNFEFEKIYSFEPIPETFELLKKNINLLSNFKKKKIVLENSAVGSAETKISIKQMVESSSSTIRDINQNSKYFNKKKKLLYFSKDDFFKKIDVNQITLNKYTKINSIEKIDFLKIDTEGYELDVLIGLENKIEKVRFILFEHHYHDMIRKNYTFSDINYFLLKNNFMQIYKSKMPFRKTFEYIYEQKPN
tara:strand:+ start:411 stop:1133 length:723 start_codon:yes stop_codon:yes gene_type:complete